MLVRKSRIVGCILTSDFSEVNVDVFSGDLSENDRLFGKESDLPGNGVDQMALYEVCSVLPAMLSLYMSTRLTSLTFSSERMFSVRQRVQHLSAT